MQMHSGRARELGQEREDFGFITEVHLQSWVLRLVAVVRMVHRQGLQICCAHCCRQASCPATQFQAIYQQKEIRCRLMQGGRLEFSCNLQNW